MLIKIFSLCCFVQIATVSAMPKDGSNPRLGIRYSVAARLRGVAIVQITLGYPCVLLSLACKDEGRIFCLHFPFEVFNSKLVRRVGIRNFLNVC